MEKLEKIFELLEKSSATKLSAEEEKILFSLIESDEEAGHFAQVYNKLKNLMTNFHLDEELLASLIMYERNEDSENKLIPIIRDKIKNHLTACDVCRADYEILKAEYVDINNFVSKRFSIKSSSAITKTSTRIFSIFTTQPVFRYAFASALFIGIIYLGLFAVSAVSTPDYIIQLSKDQHEFYITRGRTSLLFQKGLDGIENKDWEQAIGYLKEDIAIHPDERSIFYSHYVLGLTYLNASGSDFLGLFKSFDKEKVHLAINSLNNSIENNKSGNFENINLDAHYYLGTAYLLLGDFNNAYSNLHGVINKRGKFFKEAQQLLDLIEGKTSEKN